MILEKGDDLEYIGVEVWNREERVVIVNFNNPCKMLELNGLLGMPGL